MSDAFTKRERVERLLDAIMKTPQSVTAARQAGRDYFWSEGAEAPFEVFDMSPEAAAFWREVHIQTKATQRLVDALGDDDVEA